MIIFKKISKCVAILAKARRKLPKSWFISLYYSFAYPYFIYCNQVWGCNYKTNLERLVLLQKKMIRIITSSPYRAHTEPLFIANQILDVNRINDYMVSVFIYKHIKSDVPTLFSSFFQSQNSIHSHDTRRSDDLRVPKTKTNVRNFSTRINGALIWNSIPTVIRNSKSLIIFKKELKKFIGPWLLWKSLNEVINLLKSLKIATLWG